MDNANTPNDPKERGRGRDAFDQIQAKIERALDELRPKVRRAFDEMESTVDSALSELKPKVDSKMRDARPKMDSFVADIQPRMDDLLRRMQGKLEDIRRDMETRAGRAANEGDTPGDAGSAAPSPGSPPPRGPESGFGGNDHAPPKGPAGL